MAAGEATRRARRRQSISCADASKQALRAKCDDEDHWQEQNDVGQLRKQRRAECIDESDDEAADKRAQQAANAAEDDDDQRQRQHVGVETGIGGKNGATQYATGAGDPGAETKYDRKQVG